jgi:acyl-CoA oxidase
MLHELIQISDAGHRRQLAALLDEAPFKATDQTDRKEMQHRIYDQLRVLNRWAGSGSELIKDRKRLFSALEFAATVSPSLFHIAQAHYGVCLYTIQKLGVPSAQLDKIIQDLDKLSSAAVILITELGVGCSHLAVATRADYEPESDGFVLSTPDKAACKIMANVSLHGVAKTAVVFAQLWSGGENHGLFPFVLQIRDEQHIHAGVHIKLLPGESVLGMDYGLVAFDEVRIPRANWLADTATIEENGKFADSPANVERRLVRSLGAISNASTATAVGAAAAARACIWTALRYAGQRKTMGRLGAGRSILDLRNQQNLLFGALAEAYVISNLARQLVDGPEAAAMTSSIATAPWAAINRFGALTKAVTVTGAGEVIRNCRRASGAHGCLGANRFGEYEDLVVAYASAGGDNQLILIEIGRELASGNTSTNEDIPLPQISEDVQSLRQLAAFEEHRQFARATAGLSESDLSNPDLFAVWNPRLPAVIDLAKTHGCRVALERFLDSGWFAGADREVVEALATIYAVNNFGAGLSYEIRDHALARSFDIVMQHLDRALDAFDLSPEWMPAPMAQDDYVAAYAHDDLPVKERVEISMA